MTAAVLGPVFRLDELAGLLGQRPAALLPALGEVMQAALVAAADRAFGFRHELLRRAAVELVPSPARQALHGQYGGQLLASGPIPGRRPQATWPRPRIRTTRCRWPHWTPR